LLITCVPAPRTRIASAKERTNSESVRKNLFQLLGVEGLENEYRHSDFG
jgi:hypothetical protein